VAVLSNLHALSYAGIPYNISAFRLSQCSLICMRSPTDIGLYGMMEIYVAVLSNLHALSYPYLSKKRNK
ncbi:MAG: hypothetical protein AAGH79_17380, partial [Bacteroidota bacterium]